MHELAQITGLLKSSLSEVVRLRLCATSPCDVVDLVNLLKGATKLEDLELTVGCVTLVDSLIENVKSDDSLCPRLRLIESLQPNREIRDRLERRRKRLNQ
jgi:hypothetical protein